MGDRVERDPGRDAGIQRFKSRRGGDADQLVAGLGHEAGQSLALTADDDDQRPVAEVFRYVNERITEATRPEEAPAEPDLPEVSPDEAVGTA